jgi:signal transduction histidine kinase
VNGGLLSIFRRRGGQEVRTWPLLALLLVVVLGAIGCVLWFLGEAMRNERIAVRETLADAYRGHLSLLQARLSDEWNRDVAAMDGAEPAQARFARCVRDGLAESVICFDETGNIGYPVESGTSAGEELPAAGQLRAQIQGLVQAGDAKGLAQFVLGKSPAADVVADAQGRLILANAELLALEEITNKNDPNYQRIAERLTASLNNYETGSMPAAQRRFIMHELARIDPSMHFPTLAAEDLAARFLEANTAIVHGTALHATEVADVWSAESPGGRTLGLFTTEGLRAKLAGMIRDPSLPAGARLSIEPPGEEIAGDAVLASAPAGPALPGWRLAVSIDDRTLFDSEAARRVKFLVTVACIVIAAISALSILIARNFGRQVRLARLKNDLVANVSHELKTPLTAMRALVETLLNTDRLDEQTTREYLQLIATENTRLSRLIENFLAFSRLERNKFAFDFKPVQPREIIDAAVAAFGERAHAPGCTLVAGADESLPSVNADSGALTTALLNLLDNAWKYSEGDKQIRIGATARNGAVSFAVADNGIGLSPRESRRVFRRFYQADQRLARSVGGCGLGLSIVQSIVETHHGAVHVMSEHGLGSTFTIEIPAIAHPPE